MAKGDHIKVDRGAYYHHGIDVGDGTVIHFTGEPTRKSNARIKRTSLTEFLADEEDYWVISYKYSASPEVVVQRAIDYLNKGDYFLLTDNCEHFATYCKTGRWESNQVKEMTKRWISLTATVVITGGAIGGPIGIVAAPILMGGVAAVLHGWHKVKKLLN